MVVNFSSPTCFAESTVASPSMFLIYALFLSLAFISVIAIRKTNMSKAKIGLIYIHLAFLFMPLAFLSTNTACGLMCLSCHNNMFLLFLYSLPFAVLGAAFFGFVGIPSFYALASRRINNSWINDFVKKHAEAMNIRVHDVHCFSMLF